VWISSVQQTLRPISVLAAIGVIQSLSVEDNLYQGEKRTVEWKSVHSCCVETLPMVTGHTSHLLWDTLDINNFYFLFLLFSDFIGILFSFSFLLDDEEAHDIAVT